jgi:hypothetical protein
VEEASSVATIIATIMAVVYSEAGTIAITTIAVHSVTITIVAEIVSPI